MKSNKPLAERSLALLLAVVTAFSSVPTAAIAEAVDEATPQAAAAAEATDEGEGLSDAGEPLEQEGLTASDAPAANDSVAESAEPLEHEGLTASDAPADNDSVAESADDDDPETEGDPKADATVGAGDYAISLASTSVSVDYVSIVDASGNNLTYGNRTAKVGDTVKVAAYTEDDWDGDEELSSYEYAELSYQWYAGAKQSSAFTASGYTAIDGATSRELTLTSDLAGKYVACRVTYGSDSWEYEDTNSLKNAIEAASDGGSGQTDEEEMLAAAVAKAKSVGYSGWYPSPVFGTDTNICDMLSAKLEAWGYSGITVTLDGVGFTASDPAQQGGIADNGDITYFFLSPADKTASYDYSVLRQFTPTYKLTLGEASVTYTPGRTSTLPWDDDAVEKYLGEQFAAAELGDTLTSGVASADATEETLPSALYVNGKTVAQISWSSDNASAAKVTSSYDSSYNTVYKVAYTHGNESQTATLTATVSMAGASGLSSESISRSYGVTVSSKSAEQTAEEKKVLEDALAAIDSKVVAYSDSSRSVDLGNVEEDFVLPRASKVLKGASIKYTVAESSALKLTGYHGVITQDIEGGDNTATITATLTKDGLSVSRDITVTIKPIASSEIDAAVAEMEAVKAAYASSLLGDNASADAVSSDLSPWSSAVVGSDGSITYSKSYETGEIHAAELPGYDSMSGSSWRTYKSSDSAVIADETLKLAQPTADTLVTVTSNLSYEKYESLAAVHPENEQLQKLVNQTVSATYRVVGTTDHSDPQISIGFELVGVGADGTDEVWSNASQQVAYGSTAAALIEQVLGSMGLAHTSTDPATDGYYYLSDITSADGRVLGWDQATGKYWQLFVNGKASEVGADGVSLKPGDSVVLWYSAYGADIADLDKATVKVSMSFIGPDDNDNNSVWAQTTDTKVASGTTAAELSVQLLDEAGLTYEAYGEGASFYLSTVTGRDGKTYGWDQQTGKYWQLFVNGKASEVAAGSVTLQPGDKIVWAYSGYGDEVPEPDAQSAEASIEVIGLDSNGNAARWGTLSGWKFEAGKTVADLSEAFFKSAGITADYGAGAWGWSLNSVTSPYDSSIVLSSAQDSEGNWHYWQLFVNGEAASSMADGITLKNGDSVQWYYSASGDDPSSSTIVDPGAKGPDWDSDWPGYTTANKVTDAATPTKDAEAKWVCELKKSTDWSTYYSDPVLAGDYLYVAVGSTLYKKNVDTGETVAGGTATLVDKVDSVSRIVYTDGLILVPLSGGRLQAVTADSMVTRWVTSALPNGKNGKLQSLSAVTVSDGYAYFGATDASWTGSDGGYLLCVRISDGKVMWSRANENGTGYYWAGMAFSGDYGVIGDDAGNVCSIDPATGNTVSTLKVSGSVRSTVLTDGSFAYVVSNDGYLHKLSVASDGALKEVASVQFGASSTSTPVIANGKIYVGGTSIEGSPSPWSSSYVYHYGQIAVIDAETMTVEYAIDKADGSYIRQQNYSGDVKSQPVVSVQDGKTYVYFTSNNNPGCIYRYCVGDDEAEVLYTPEADGQQYCMSSIAVGSDGALYYANDSGKLFAVKGNGKRAQRFIVSFDLNGGAGETPAPQKVKEGTTVVQPTNPVRAGYKFCGWYTDAACTSAWDFSQGVEGNMTLTAKWEEVKKGGESGGGSGSGGSGTTPSGTDPAAQPDPDPAPQPGSGAGAGAGTGAGSGSGISLSGNTGSGSSNSTTAAVSLAGALKSTTTAVVETATEETSAESLLTGFASEQMSAATSAGSAAAGNSGASANSGAASAGTGSAAASRGLPIWPFIGMGAGAAALIAVLAAKRKKEDEQ